MISHELRNNSVPLEDQYLKFRLGDGLYAVGIAGVEKVIRIKELKRVFKGPKYLIGKTMVAGEQIPVFSLNQLLGLERLSSNLAILFRHNQIKIAYQIDKVEGVCRYPEVTSTPKGLRLPRFLAGLIADGENIIQLIDLRRIPGSRLKKNLKKIMEES